MVKIEQHKICFEIIDFKNLVDKKTGQEDGEVGVAEVGVAESISKRWVVLEGGLLFWQNSFHWYMKLLKCLKLIPQVTPFNVGELKV